MTSLIVSKDFSIDSASINWLRTAAPDIESVTMADSISQMCESVAASTVPLVTMINGAEDHGSLEAVADTFLTGSTRGGVVAVGEDDSSEHVTQAFLSGVRGWVLAVSPIEELITGIRAVASGHLFLPSALLYTLASTVPLLAFDRGFDHAAPDLTGRELDVVELLAIGQPNAQIATDLFISVATVHSHVLNILRKFNARNRTEAVVRAYQRGIVAPAIAPVQHARAGSQRPFPHLATKHEMR